MTDYIFWSFPNGGTSNLIFPCKWYLTIEVLVRLTVITHDDCLSLQGCGFLCVSKDNQHMIKPLVVSSGFTAGFNSQFIWTGKTNAACEFPIMNDRLLKHVHCIFLFPVIGYEYIIIIIIIIIIMIIVIIFILIALFPKAQ